MLRCNGNAQRMGSPFDEARYSQDGVLQSNGLSDELVTTGKILQSSRLSNELPNTGGDLTDGEVQSRQLSNELVITGEVCRSSGISNEIEMLTTVHNNSLIEHNSPNRHRQSYGVHLPLHHGTAGNSHYVRDVFLSPKYTRLLVSITTTKTPPLSSEMGDAIRLNRNQETNIYCIMSGKRMVVSIAFTRKNTVADNVLSDSN